MRIYTLIIKINIPRDHIISTNLWSFLFFVLFQLVLLGHKRLLQPFDEGVIPPAVKPLPPIAVANPVPPPVVTPLPQAPAQAPVAPAVQPVPVNPAIPKVVEPRTNAFVAPPKACLATFPNGKLAPAETFDFGKEKNFNFFRYTMASLSPCLMLEDDCGQSLKLIVVFSGKHQYW